MDYLQLIRKITEILNQAKEYEIATEVTLTVRSASTGTELLMFVTYALNQILKNNQHLINVIGPDVRTLNEFCSSIGLYINK